MVLLRYTGSSAGARTWRGPTGRVYTFSALQPLGQVLAEDAEYLTRLSEFTVVTV